MKWLLAAGLVSLATMTNAQQVPCAPHLQAGQTLAEKYQEAVVARGLDADGNIIELYVNTETGTYSVLLVHPTGNACLVSSGEAMQLLEPVLIPAGEPA